jgi:hypothetical protein
MNILLGVPYIFLEGGEGGDCIRYYIRDGIRNYNFQEIFLLRSNMFVALEIEVEDMEMSCILILIVENG